MTGINSYWTISILKKAGYYSFRQVLFILENLDEKRCAENNLVSKNEFILHLKNLFHSIEQTGETLRESREMLSKGSIFEGMFAGQYGNLRSAYTADRKKFEKQLLLIKLLFS